MRVPAFANSHGFIQALERQVSVAQGKYHDIEDLILQMERDKGTQDRQLEATRKQLEGESAKRAQLEKTLSSHKEELAKLKDHNAQLDAELNKALSELKTREWESKQIESKQHTTIVEHVHVLEEAKRVTDRQLAEAQDELQKNVAYIRSLEKAKVRLAGEAEDLIRETERERLELRTKEKAAKSQEDRMAKALLDAERERKDKDNAELQTRRLQIELQSAQHQVEELTQQLSLIQRSKDQLETDLDRLADDTGEAPVSMARRIAQLEGQLIEAKSSRVQPRYSGDVYSTGDWRKEKEGMEAKIANITKAYEASTAAQAEQRSQIASLHSQVRDLRGVLDDAEADRVLLQKARRALQSELETIKHDHVDTAQIPTDREFHKLQLSKLDLERSLEEQEYRTSNSLDRMRKAEAYANDANIALGKQIKELKARIADLESKPHTNSPRPAARRESRIEELTNQLNQTNKGRR
ncbi:myosin tail-domain-containing protein [Mycena rosella]|uniref:Myosin tail-domain-containing protein n=1 Tax=Mycena rosella TaxID=1033263 RepID=A0AAD7GTZ4_MYCRO|nr:myosin tail-domain-containing protein [Mycena rosella]